MPEANPPRRWPDGRIDCALLAMAIALAVFPLWGGGAIPQVDLPQHLHLISVLHRLDDPTTLYPATFERRAGFTPYLGYYYAVDALNWLLPLEAANRLFLSLYVGGMALAMAFLLRSLRRPAWPALLALPFAYGDSFGWGFTNFCAALPLTFLASGLAVRAVADSARRRQWSVALGAAGIGVLLFHIQAFFFFAIAAPLLIALTRAPDSLNSGGARPALAARVWALGALVPTALLSLIWGAARATGPTEVEYGAPWKAWGPMLSPQNLSFKPLGQSWDELIPVLGNLFRDGSDRWPVYAAFAVAGLGAVAGLAFPEERAQAPLRERLRLPALGLLALALYFTLPFDIRGYIYYLNTRYAHLAAPLVLASLVPPARPGAQRILRGLACVPALGLALVLTQGFRAYAREAAPLVGFSRLVPPRARVMGLLFNPGSRVMTHPVYLHAAATLARLAGGICNFSFALTPHSPVKYRGPPPPTFPSEWRPDAFRYQAIGGAYDAFVLRGAPPWPIFGPHLGTELRIAGKTGDGWLVLRDHGESADESHPH